MPTSIPAPMPGVMFPPGMPPGPPALMPPGMPPPGTVTVTSLVDDHGALKELPTGDLIPPPGHGSHHGGHGCDHCGDHHEIPGFMTPFIPEHSGWYVGGEFLLMRPRNSDFDYVIRGANPGLATVGPIESLKYGVGTGLRAELGRRFGEHGKWELAFAYTYFTSGDTSTVFAGGNTLFPTLTRPGLTDRALTATANADLDYQLFDMIAARRVLVDENFGVRFIGGLRFADTRQIANAFYDGADARQARVNTRSRFEGFGPIVGAEAVLAGWKGFHLYSRALGGLLTGRDTNTLIETNDAGATTYVNTTYNVQKVVPMASIAVGGGWQYRTISIRGGFEVTHMQGVFERPRFVDDVSQGKVITRPSNLTLEGLFIQVGLSF